MFIIFTAKKEADTLESKISKSMELPKGNTLRYGNVIKHQSKSRWALVINNGAYDLLTSDEIGKLVDLDSDWYPIIDEL